MASKPTVVDLFLRQAARTPDSLAVSPPPGDSCGWSALSYAQLRRRAVALASVLRSDYGVGTERLVLSFVEEGPALVVGELAVLMASMCAQPESIRGHRPCWFHEPASCAAASPHRHHRTHTPGRWRLRSRGPSRPPTPPAGACRC